MIVNYIANKKISFERVKEILEDSARANHYTNNGPVKQKLEEKLHSLLNISNQKKVLCVSSGTAALHVLMLYYKGIEWVVPSFNFPSAMTNTKDVFAKDINSKTFTLDPWDDQIEDDKPNLIGVIITNLFGANCQIEPWVDSSEKNRRILIFDNASSPLTTINSINICNFGNASFGSLHHTKYLGFGEGGFIVCDEDKYDEISSLTNFGFHNSRKYKTNSSNFKMSDVSAAFILAHIEAYDLDKHLYVQERFVDNLREIPEIKLLNYCHGTIYGNLPVIFSKPIDNKIFKDIGIEANKYYFPLQEFDKNSVDLYTRIVNFPLNDSLTEYQIDFIIKQIKNNL